MSEKPKSPANVTKLEEVKGFGQITRRQKDDAYVIWHLTAKVGYIVSGAVCPKLPLGALVEISLDADQLMVKHVKKIDKDKLPNKIKPLLPVPSTGAGAPPPSGGPPKPKPKLSTRMKQKAVLPSRSKKRATG